MCTRDFIKKMWCWIFRDNQLNTLFLPRQGEGVSINSLTMCDIDLCYWLASGRILTTCSISACQVPPPGHLNNPIFSNFRSCAACWVHMCHHEFWQTSASHPISSLNSSLGLAGRNRLLSSYSFLSLSFVLTSGWYVIAVWGSIVVQGTSEIVRITVNRCRVAVSNDKST